MYQLSVIFAILFVFFIYYLGKVLFSALFGVHESHIFIGFGKKPIFTFTIRQLKISMGFFIPFPWLARFYRYENGVKTHPRYTWEFFDKSIYKRMLVTFGGFFTMLLTSIVIFIVLEYNEVDTFISKEEVNKHGIYPLEVGREIGLKESDRIILINGYDYERFTDLYSIDVFLSDNAYLTVLREGDTIRIDMPPNFIGSYDLSSGGFIDLKAPIRIDKIQKYMPAHYSNLGEGDIIKTVEGETIESYEELKKVISEHRNDTITIVVDRRGEEVSTEVSVTDEGVVGIMTSSVINYTSHKKSFAEAIGSGFIAPFKMVIANIKSTKRMIMGEFVPTGITRGPIKAAGNFGNSQIFKMIAVYLALLCFYELLPLPKTAALHSIPILLDGIFNKKVSHNAFRSTQRGLWSVFALFALWIIFNDIMNMFF